MSTLATHSTSPLYLDFSLIGRAPRFRTRLLAYRRAQLHEGEIVEVVGDGIPVQAARVLHVSALDPEVEFEFVKG